MYKTFVKVLPLFIVLAQYSCKKQTDIPVQIKTAGELMFKTMYRTDNKIRINEAAVIYDALFIKDSVDFSQPPTGRYYVWKTTASKDCVEESGFYKNGLATFIFHCSGEYQVSATIFDSLTQQQIGHTDTIAVSVRVEKLQQFQTISSDDSLTVSPWVKTVYPSGQPYIELVFSTSKIYDYYYTAVNYTETVGLNSHAYVFTNIKLTTFPFSYGPDVTQKVYGVIDMKDVTAGVPVNISLNWLGKIYTGSITLLNDKDYTLNWTNTGAVVFTN